MEFKAQNIVSEVKANVSFARNANLLLQREYGENEDSEEWNKRIETQRREIFEPW